MYPLFVHLYNMVYPLLFGIFHDLRLAIFVYEPNWTNRPLKGQHLFSIIWRGPPMFLYCMVFCGNCYQTKSESVMVSRVWQLNIYQYFMSIGKSIYVF